MKYILVIGDGMADNGIPELGGKTPLQYAKIPTMDEMASAGVQGNALTVPKGMPPGSDTAILSIFGCDPTLCYGGRASLEAAATGIKLAPGDIAYRCNMVTFEDGEKPFSSKKLLSHSAGGIEGDISDNLVTELFMTPGFKEAAQAANIEIFPSGSFRHIAVERLHPSAPAPDVPPTAPTPAPPPVGDAPLRGATAALPPLAPPHDHIGEPIGQLLPQGKGNAATLANLMRTAHEILDAHPTNNKRRDEKKLPANGIWFWAAGVATALPNFREKYSKTGSVISAVPLCRGIGTLMGLDIIIVPGATGELYTNYVGKVNAAFESLRTRDFAAIHIEAPDECTHGGDLKGKLQAIEWVDSRVIEPLAKRLRESGIDFRMLVISDHKTLLSTRGHCGDPVPFLIYDSRLDKNGADSRSKFGFCEANAEKGQFIADGTALMGMLFDQVTSNK